MLAAMLPRAPWTARSKLRVKARPRLGDHLDRLAPPGGEVRVLRWRRGLALSVEIQASFPPTSSPCAALRFEGTTHLLSKGILPRQDTSIVRRQGRKGSSRPTFSFLPLIGNWEKVLESSTN